MTSGWYAGLAACMAATTLVAADFKSGAVKNYLQARGGRLSWAGATAVFALVTVAAYALFALVATDVGFRLAGYDLAPTNPLDALRWLGQFAITVAAYTMLAEIAIVLTKSEMIGALVIVLLMLAGIEQATVFMLGLIPGIPSDIAAWASNHLIITDFRALTSSPLPWGSCLEGLIVFAAASALVALIMKKRKL